MNKHRWSNQQFYGEKLKSDPHVSRIVLADLKEKKKRPVVDPPNFYSAGKENNKFPEPDKFSRPTTPFIDYPLVYFLMFFDLIIHYIIYVN
jgi:hypothetical protein